MTLSSPPLPHTTVGERGQGEVVKYIYIYFFSLLATASQSQHEGGKAGRLPPDPPCLFFFENKGGGVRAGTLGGKGKTKGWVRTPSSQRRRYVFYK